MNFVEDLLPETLISAPGCPEIVVRRHIQSAARDFYRESCAWRHTTEAGSVTRGDPEVELEVPTGATVVRIYWAKLAGKQLRATSPRNLEDGAGEPSQYTFDTVTSAMRVGPTPVRSYILDGVVAHLALAPKGEELPEALFETHRDGILYGAIAKLLVMPNTPWADLQAAANYAAMAGGLLNAARRQAESLRAPVVRVTKYGGL